MEARPTPEPKGSRMPSKDNPRQETPAPSILAEFDDYAIYDLFFAITDMALAGHKAWDVARKSSPRTADLLARATDNICDAANTIFDELRERRPDLYES